MGCLNTLPFAAGTFCKECGVGLRLVKKGIHSESDKPSLLACFNDNCSRKGIVIVDEFEVV